MLTRSSAVSFARVGVIRPTLLRLLIKVSVVATSNRVGFITLRIVKRVRIKDR
jgi:hypothetical protein